MKHQALFSLKDKSEKLKCRLLQSLFSALRVEKFLKLPLFLADVIKVTEDVEALEF